MEKAALQKIIEAEKRADEIVADSNRISREISEKSADEIKKMRVEYEELLDREIKEIINKKIKDADIKVVELEASFISECDKIRDKASVNIDKAVAFVVDKIGSGKWQ